MGQALKAIFFEMGDTVALTLEQLNAASAAEAVALLDGVYEHSPWIAEAALAQRPFKSLAHLKHAMVQVLQEAGEDAQLALIRAHPELAGKAAVARQLTAESTNEQSKAGLTDCTPAEFEHIQQLNRDYNTRFGFPFILAVRGPRGTGLARSRKSSTPLHGGWTTTPNLSWPRPCATSTALPRFAGTTSSLPSQCWATMCGTGTKRWPGTLTPALPKRASSR